MQARPLGPDGPQVAPLALGCAGMSDHTARADEADAIATIHTALDAGVTLLDTADFYGMGSRERGTVVAVVGARRPQRVEEALAAAGLGLTDAELRTIDEAVPADAVAGTRYAAPLTVLLDSERGSQPSGSTRK